MNFHEQCELNMKRQIQRFTTADPFQEVYLYALLPAGKLFRPQLVVEAHTHFTSAIQSHQAFLNPFSALSLVASAMEIHHSYTLVHDDMPCMDNDDWRRGRPSTHQAYGQWKALLAGDGLHGLSYRLVARAPMKYSSNLLNLMGHALGAKGLIEGQYLDLSGEMTNSFSALVRTHLLKTARLIQLSILAGALVAEEKSYRSLVRLAKLGETMGLCFQFIDDLSELTQELGEHELQVNPWLNFPSESLTFTTKLLLKLQKELPAYPGIQLTFAQYAQKMLELLKNGQSCLEENLTHHKESKSLVMSEIQGLITLFELLCLKQ
jgi:geranylgeranyl pyrophosphate synthase